MSGPGRFHRYSLFLRLVCACYCCPGRCCRGVEVVMAADGGSSLASIASTSALCWLAVAGCGLACFDNTPCGPPPGSRPLPAVGAANGGELAGEDYLHVYALWAAARQPALAGCSAAAGAELAGADHFISVLYGPPPGSRPGPAVGRRLARSSLARTASMPCGPPSGWL
jgi:hypothetical protein